MCVVGRNGYAQSLSAVQQALYYENYQKANQLAAEQVLQKIGIGKSLFWQSFAALETGDSALIRLNIDRAQSNLTPGPKWDPYLSVIPVFYYIFQNEGDKAKKLSDSVLKATDFKDPEFIQSIAALMVSHPNHQAQYALSVLERIPLKKRNTAFYYQIQGDAYRRLIQGGNAVTAYQKAIQLQPDFAKAYTSIARIYQTQANHALAIQWLEKAIEQDSLYGPAYFELFYSSYYSQPSKAKEYLEKFVALSELSLAQLYMQMDFYFMQRQYKDAIDVAEQILSRRNLQIAPRVHKLKAYAFAALKDSMAALKNMETYFYVQSEPELIAKDYQFYSKLLLSQKETDRSVLSATNEKALLYAADFIDSANAYHAFLQLAIQEKKNDDVIGYAEKLGALTGGNMAAIDLYHWGMAYYQKEMYHQSDSVFTLYTKRYPNEVYGWLWKARSLSHEPDQMYEAATIYAYKMVIELGEKQLSRFENVVIQSHGYVGAYYANFLKNYDEALKHFQAILKIDPLHYDAQQYVDLLLEWTR
jgi:hypothetical protein